MNATFALNCLTTTLMVASRYYILYPRVLECVTSLLFDSGFLSIGITFLKVGIKRSTN